MQKINPPCLNCERRYVGCHDRCDDYLSFKRKREELKKLKEKAKLCSPPHRKDDD